MTIIVPYLAQQNSIELLYALRSIEKFHSDKNLILIGKAPAWFKGETIVAPDLKDKHTNIKNKITIAYHSSHVDEDFIWWSDDYFQIKPTEILNWHDGTLLSYFVKVSGKYKRCCEYTMELFPYGLFYDTHLPRLFNKTKLEKMFKEIDWMAKDYLIQSTYCNFINEPAVEVRDCKFQNNHSFDQIREVTKDKAFFSTQKYSMNEPMVKVLNGYFPNKSKFE